MKGDDDIKYAVCVKKEGICGDNVSILIIKQQIVKKVSYVCKSIDFDIPVS